MQHVVTREKKYCVMSALLPTLISTTTTTTDPTTATITTDTTTTTSVTVFSSRKKKKSPSPQNFLRCLWEAEKISKCIKKKACEEGNRLHHHHQYCHRHELCAHLHNVRRDISSPLALTSTGKCSCPSKDVPCTGLDFHWQASMPFKGCALEDEADAA